MAYQLYKYPHPFELESGAVLPSLEIAYHTYGERCAADDNIIWVCHALTANSDVADWWPHTVEEGCFLDPTRYFTVCANILGSHYGTTGPWSINPTTGERWYGDFPSITVRDMVRVHQLLAEHLGIRRVKLLIGSSIGGFQCLEWAVMQPDFMERAAFIATSPQVDPWIAGFNESQRMAIENDATFGERSDEAGLNGMAVARSIALLSYRGAYAYKVSQAEENPDECCFERRVASYQRYQGEKLRRRFNAYSYYLLSRAVDSHNIARGRGALAAVVSQIKAKSLVVAISSDLLFTPADHRVLVDNIVDVEYHEIDSLFGHDGFLVEHRMLNEIVLKFMG